MSNVAGSFFVSNGPKFEFLSIDKEVTVSGYKGGVLVGSSTLSSSNNKAVLMDSSGVGDYSASVSLDADTTTKKVTLSYTITYSGQSGVSTKTGSMGAWSYVSGE